MLEEKQDTLCDELKSIFQADESVGCVGLGAKLLKGLNVIFLKGLDAKLFKYLSAKLLIEVLPDFGKACAEICSETCGHKKLVGITLGAILL